MTGWRWAAAAVLTAAVAGCGAADEPAPGINQRAADRQAELDEQARQAERDYRDAMRNFEDVVLTVPGDGSYTIPF